MSAGSFRLEMAHIHIRSRNAGKSFELRIKHRLLDKPIYRTCSTHLDAERAGSRALEDLEAGQVPQWLMKPEPAQVRTIAATIRAYRTACAVAFSTDGVLDAIVKDVGTVAVSQISFAWAEEWVRQLKLAHRNAPGTIRKKKGALSRVLDWFIEYHPLLLTSNPLPRLPHGYSSYNDRIAAQLRGDDHDVPQDIERNRRIDPDEEARIVAEIERQLALAPSPAQRADLEGKLLIFQLALQTAMRLREIYTLTLDQIDLERRTIYLKRSKSGDGRSVPLNAAARNLLSRDWPALTAVRAQNRLFPHWGGNLSKACLKEVSDELSKAFQHIFEQAGCIDLNFHDTRHEAIVRWVLNAPKPITSEQLGRAAGMKGARTRQRYLSLRGSELVDLLE